MAFEITFLTLFWVLSAVIVFLTHILMKTCKDQLPKRFKAAWMFGKFKSISELESMTPFPVPKRWFTHFYAFGLLVHSVVFTLFVIHLNDKSFLPEKYKLLELVRFPATAVSERNGLSAVMVFTMEWFQIARRLQECLFVSSFSDSTMSPIHYFYGMFFYSSIGLGLLSFMDIKHLRFELTSSDMVYYVPAVILFLIASHYQHKAFLTFASLRNVKKEKSATGHFIPHGHLFNWVSCPHYLCEMTIYFSLALVFKMTCPLLNSQLAFVVVNQTCCSILSHDWYRNTFKDYPSQRKAVIPYIL